jgi:hypothetical protein
MRFALVLSLAVLAPLGARAADPALTFQVHPMDRVFGDLRVAADLVGGQKAVKAFNKNLEEALGKKGLDGLDISRPIVGYVTLGAKFEDTTVVIAAPTTGEKEFLALLDRINFAEHKPLKDGLYAIPSLTPEFKARLRFANQHAYLAFGLNPEAALDPKGLADPAKLYDPAERGLVAAKLHFDRIPADFKKSLLAQVGELKKKIDELQKGPLGAGETILVKEALPELEKLFARYVLLAAGADTLTLRFGVDVPSADVLLEATLKPKADTALAKLLAARKPTTNKFGGLLGPDTVAGFKTRLPFPNDELRAAAVKGLEAANKEAGNGAPQNVKPVLDELFKGLARTVKTGEFDIAGGVRGPDKNGDFTAALAVAFEDPAALEKEFKKLAENDPPPFEIKWDADKLDKVNIHTVKLPGGGGGFFGDVTKPFGGETATVAFAFAPKGVFVFFGPDAVKDLKAALVLKPQEAPVLDVLINPARVAKFAGKFEPMAEPEVEKALGKEDKLISAASLRVSGGKELNVAFALNLRLLPRAIFAGENQRGEPFDKAQDKAEVEPLKKR